MEGDLSSLTSQEAQAIAQAMGPDLGEGAKQVALAAGDRQAKRLLPAVSLRWREFFVALRAEVSRAFSRPLPVAHEPLALGGPMAMGEEVSAWLMGAMIRREQGEPLAWFGVSPRLGFHLIEMAFGAPNEPSADVPARRHLTPVEQQTLWPFLDHLGARVKSHLLVDAKEPLVVEPLGFPPKVGTLATDESGLTTHVTFPLGEYTAQLGFVLGPKALDIFAAHEVQDSGLSAAAISRALGAVEVLLVANLGTTRLSVSRVAALTPGETLWLDQTQKDPVDVRVEGLVKFHAHPMQRDGVVGVKIQERF